MLGARKCMARSYRPGAAPTSVDRPSRRGRKKSSASRWRFRPPSPKTFAFRLLPSGAASTYSRSVLAARRKLRDRSGPCKGCGRRFPQSAATCWSRRGSRDDAAVDEGLVLLLVGAILASSLVVALGASRTGVPLLVAFLALGMLLGSDGPGGIAFDDAELARSVGVVCLAAILFEGGLSTSWRRLRRVAVPAALLSTVGVLVTALATGAA